MWNSLLSTFSWGQVTYVRSLTRCGGYLWETFYGAATTLLEGGGVSWDTSYRAATSLLEDGRISWDISYRAATSLLEGGGVSWDTSYRAATTLLEDGRISWDTSYRAATSLLEGGGVSWDTSYRAAITLLEGGEVSWDPSMDSPSETSSCTGMARTPLCRILCSSDIITTVAGSWTLSFTCHVRAYTDELGDLVLLALANALRMPTVVSPDALAFFRDRDFYRDCPTCTQALTITDNTTKRKHWCHIHAKAEEKVNIGKFTTFVFLLVTVLSQKLEGDGRLIRQAFLQIWHNMIVGHERPAQTHADLCRLMDSMETHGESWRPVDIHKD